jgi:hypothetical protein
MHRVWCLVLAMCIALGLGGTRVDAATIFVATGEVIVNPGNNKCSLREAINNANAGGDTSGGDCTPGDPGADEIVLAPGSIYNLPDVAHTSADFGLSGLPAITSTIDLKGSGATIQRSPSLLVGSQPCDSSSNFRLFFVDTKGDLTLENVLLRNGCASFSDGTGAGGAILNIGAATLMQTRVTGNEASQSGGGIHNDGTLDLLMSTVSGNEVIDGAGGGIVNTGKFTSTQSTISWNATPGAGGAMYNPGTTTMANSTISGNEADGTGGGLQNESDATLTNVTVSANTATRSADSPFPGFGGGIFENNGTVTLGNTIVAQQSRGTDCYGSITSNGHNLDSDGTCNVQASDLTSSTPGLGPLSNNGGPTLTQALLLGSPAIDHGDNAMCAAAPVNDVDQRDVSRPRNGGISLTCDIGAFELCLECLRAAPAASAPVLAGLLVMLLVSGVYTAQRSRARR